eukprot:NODE_14_length_51535_cov_1.125049.p28 type:complete len:267 gc:universal NODE_14_length_51535_cov_1.125049:15104-15904(+)
MASLIGKFKILKPMLRKRSRAAHTFDDSKFKKFDAFSKPAEEVKRSTQTTRSVSWMVSSFLILVVFAEIYHYLNPIQIQDFTVDTDISTRNDLKINLDIFLAMPCDDLSIDILDESDTLYRANGAFHKKSAESLIDYDQRSEKQEYKPGQAIKQAYKQQKRSVQGEKVSGCQVYGTIELPKLHGNLHVTPSGHLHSGKHANHDTMNLTHKITNLNFGENYPGLVNPLNDVKKVATGHFWNYRYYIHIVPTTYISNLFLIKILGALS